MQVLVYVVKSEAKRGCVTIGFRPTGRIRRGLAFFLRVLAAWTNLRGSRNQDRPAAFVTADDGLAQHAPDHRATAPAAAGTGADSGAFADLLEGFRAGPNRFEHGAFADLVAQASGLQILDDRLFFGVSFQLVDGAPLEKKSSFTVSLAQRGGAATNV